MPRLNIKDIQPQVSVDEVYKVIDKQHRANRQGNMYLLMQFADRTGKISGMRWNADVRLYESFQKGDFLRVEAAAQLHNGQLQLIVNKLDFVDPSTVNPEDFDRVDHQRVAQQWEELRSMIEKFHCRQCKSIAEVFFEDETIAEAFKIAPAGIKAHHSHPGGLLEHVLEMMTLCSLVASRYQHVNKDLLVLGAMLHDIGKLEELKFDNELSYSDPGQLLGHLVQGIQMLDRRMPAIETRLGKPLETDFLMRLQHMIVSHHGSLEHGSPKLPMTLEALVLHSIDEMDAKVNSATGIIREDHNTDSKWTAFNPMMGRKFFKPSDEAV